MLNYGIGQKNLDNGREAGLWSRLSEKTVSDEKTVSGSRFAGGSTRAVRRVTASNHKRIWGNNVSDLGISGIPAWNCPGSDDIC